MVAMEQQTPKEPACLNPAHSDRPAEIRGLCHTCYSTALALIHKKATTWENLVKAGRALNPLPSKRPAGTIKTWLLENPPDPNSKKP